MEPIAKLLIFILLRCNMGAAYINLTKGFITPIYHMKPIAKLLIFVAPYCIVSMLHIP